ncbi:30S ribosomal protein S17 [Ignicoccus islandicus DSM 13165]|uniref:Small ribosomal subunit protein uS17 n=1 Tax=Ignicoccus islandicus DSM 13165 TaxID=940295 RepID=A0A0U3FZ30_9CREN|nr:30S ribosomal protein S17 [Ignicoccus islandicus]ALU11356.1 30S ribosomal protein S17 [Ignicoccus islandicus DSM 13165]
MSAVEAGRVGIRGVEPPKIACDDPECPWHGHLKVRGTILEGIVVKKRMQKAVVVRHEYLYYNKKYQRYERRKKNIHARLPPCLANEIKEGDVVVIGETRPLAKSISFVVLGRRKTGGEE